MRAERLRLSEEQGQRILRLYHLYRLTIGLVLVLLISSELEDQVLKLVHPELFHVGSWCYLVFNILVALFLPPSRQLLPIFILALTDVLMLCGLFYAGGGVPSGIGSLLVVAVAIANILLRGRIGLVIAAAASLGLLYLTFFLSLSSPDATNHYVQAGGLGTLCFAAALVIQALVRRQEQTETLAEERAETVANLEELNALILQRMRTGILVVDSRQAILLANQAALGLLRQDDVQGASLGRHSPMLMHCMKQWRLNPSLRPPTLKVVPDGPTVQPSFISLNREDDQHVLIFLEDISQIAQQAQQMKLAGLGRLTAGIAHEIRNPLGAISHAAQLLQESEELDAPDRRLTQIIQDQSKRMNLVIENVLQLSRRRQAEPQQLDLCLTDMRLPDGSGLDLVQYIQQRHPQTPVAMITAYGSLDTAIQALKAGAFDFLTKPVDLGRLRELVATALRLRNPEAEEAPVDNRLLGESPPMRALRNQIGKLARSQAPVYISGESGSGKELVARLIHEQGPRIERPFVPVNCGAIPSELMESEFFGHKKGSFTGAIEDKQGLFQAASGGTLFLDEVADLPMAMQVKLLRAIQEKAVRAVGGQQEVAVDVRILCATHKDLAAEVGAGRFRQDLYYRLNVIELRVPPLRERREDIPLLAERILKRLAGDTGLPAARLTGDAQEKLKNYRFPGNVRELENMLERAYTLCEDDQIQPHDLRLADAPGASQEGAASLSEIDNLEDYLEDIERKLIMQALEETRWNRTAAAQRLGLTFRSMRYRLKKLGID